MREAAWACPAKSGPVTISCIDNSFDAGTKWSLPTITPGTARATGISQAYQALYTMSSPGVWTFAETVPIVGPMVWSPPSDYNFPLDKFWLYNTTAEGKPGSERRGGGHWGLMGAFDARVVL